MRVIAEIHIHRGIAHHSRTQYIRSLVAQSDMDLMRRVGDERDRIRHVIHAEFHPECIGDTVIQSDYNPEDSRDDHKNEKDKRIMEAPGFYNPGKPVAHLSQSDHQSVSHFLAGAASTNG